LAYTTPRCRHRSWTYTDEQRAKEEFAPEARREVQRRFAKWFAGAMRIFGRPCTPAAAGDNRFKFPRSKGGCRSNPDPLDLIERNLVLSTIVELGGARRFVRGDLLRVLERNV
jgi:hypothetical protein